MSTKRKKRGTRRSGTSIIVPLIIILLAAVAAIAIYYLSERPKTVQKPQAKQIQNQQRQIKNTQPESPVKTKPKAKTLLEGTWISQSDGAMLQFHDHTFNIDFPSVDSHNYKKGSFSIEGKQITFSYEKGETPCDKEKGIYTFRISKGILHLKVEKDNCKSRRGKLVADWERFSSK